MEAAEQNLHILFEVVRDHMSQNEEDQQKYLMASSVLSAGELDSGMSSDSKNMLARWIWIGSDGFGKQKHAGKVDSDRLGLIRIAKSCWQGGFG